MKILFLDIKLSKASEKSLAASRVAFDCVSSGDWTKALTEDCDVVVWSAGSDKNLSVLQTIKTKFSRVWAIAIVPEKWLTTEATKKTLLANGDKDELWIESTWETSLPFFVQSFFKRTQSETALLDQVSTLVKQLERDVELAAGIQRAILPKKAPEIPGVDITVRYVPAAGSGGDYYDIFEFGDRKKFGVIVADSKTHGMAASLLSVLVKVRLDEMKERFTDTKAFVEFLNQEIREVHEKEMAELSLIFGVIDRASLTFQYTSAGNLSPVLCRMGENQKLAQLANPPLGSHDKQNFHENTLRLQPGDHLLFFTDGWEHLMNGQARKQIEGYLEAQMKSGQEGQTVSAELMGLVDRQKDAGKLKDDVTLIHFSIQERIMYLAQPKR